MGPSFCFVLFLRMEKLQHIFVLTGTMQLRWEMLIGKEKIAGMSLSRQEGLRLMAYMEGLAVVGTCMSSIEPGEG